MPAKYKGRSFCSAQQIQQITETYDYLRELHRDIYDALRHLSRSTDTDKQTADFYCGAAEEIGGALKFLV